jgi:uridine phosphorylase
MKPCAIRKLSSLFVRSTGMFAPYETLVSEQSPFLATISMMSAYMSYFVLLCSLDKRCFLPVPLLLNAVHLILITVSELHRSFSRRRQYHIACGKGDLAEYLLVPGDPDRVPKIVSHWDSAREVSSHREFRSFTGEYKRVPISALSSGIGPACMAIAVNEASSVGVTSFIRVGSTGAIQRGIACGDLVISSAAVRLDRTSDCYVMPEYPAVANYEVLLALIEAAERLGVFNYRVGVTATTADFYAGQGRREREGFSRGADDLVETLREGGVLSFDMETATLFTLAGLCGLRAGSVCAVYANRVTGEVEPGRGEEEAIRVANEAVRILWEWDALKVGRKKRWLYPSLIGRR